MRKIININDHIDWSNKQMKRTDEFATQAFKAGIFMSMSRILMDLNKYNGFGYIYWSEGGYDEWHKAGEPGGAEKDKYIYGGSKEENRYNRFFYYPN